MNWRKTIKLYYDLGYYSNEDLQVFVRARLITQEEADEIIAEKKNDE